MADIQILDSVLLTVLAKRGIVTSNVELWRDYAPRSRGQGYSPYTRTYQDTRSGKKFAVISGLPGCDAYGQAQELVWQDKNGVIENGNNIFHSNIEKGTTRILALSDQPAGARKDDEVNFHPQLFIDGVEILPRSDTPKLLETDPLNNNYPYNTLEWDFGICLRRIRLIEGRFLGSWVFLTSPKGDVLIKYNQSGKLRLRLQYPKDDDTEFIPKAFFNGASEWPVIISDSATFYPDADPESATVDGYAYHYSDWSSWSAMLAAAGNAADDSGSQSEHIKILSRAETDHWFWIHRCIYLFDTSVLGSGASISAATFSLRGWLKQDGLSCTPDMNVYSSDPASNTGVVAGDYDCLGSTAFCDTPITYAAFNTSGWNDMAFNATGLAAINKTGITKLGTRNANYDVAGTEPNWVASSSSNLRCYWAEAGEGYQPKLVVTYTTGVTERSSAETGAGIEAKTSGHPIVMAGGAETGSGLESLGSRDLGGAETGSGLESLDSLGLGAIETGAGTESLVGRGLSQSETGAGLESLGSRDLGNIETGTGVESLGSRELGGAEVSSGLDIACLLAALAGGETGSGAEATLKIAAFFSGDAGLGAELSWMLKDAVCGEVGDGKDALKSLIKTEDSSSDMRLYERRGHTRAPSRQVRMPSKGVNL